MTNCADELFRALHGLRPADAALRRKFASEPALAQAALQAMMSERLSAIWPLSPGSSTSLYWLCLGQHRQATGQALRSINVQGQARVLNYGDVAQQCSMLARDWQSTGVLAGARVLLGHADPVALTIAWLCAWHCGLIPVLGAPIVKGLAAQQVIAAQAAYTSGFSVNGVPELALGDPIKSAVSLRAEAMIGYRPNDPVLSSEDLAWPADAPFIDWTLEATVLALWRDALLFWPHVRGSTVLVPYQNQLDFSGLWQTLCALCTGATVSFVDVNALDAHHRPFFDQRFDWVMLSRPFVARLAYSQSTGAEHWKCFSLGAMDGRSRAELHEVHQRYATKSTKVCQREVQISSGGVGMWSVPVVWDQLERASAPWWPALGVPQKPAPAPSAATEDFDRELLLAPLPSGELMLIRDTRHSEITWRRCEAWLVDWFKQTLHVDAYFRRLTGSIGEVGDEVWITSAGPSADSLAKSRVAGLSVEEVRTVMQRELGAQAVPPHLFIVDALARQNPDGSLDQRWCEEQISRRLWPEKGELPLFHRLQRLRNRLLDQRAL